MAGLDCSKIKTGFTNQVCGKPAIAGTTARVILVSYSDVDKAKSVVADNIISSLILKPGATGYEVDSLPNATVGSDTINAGTYMKTHQHNVVVRIFKKSEAAKRFVNGLTNARVIAIVENNDRGDNGDTKYEVYGWDSGLELTEITVTTEMTDGVAYQVTLANGTIAQEGSLPMSLYNTDEATTDLMVNGLINGGGGGNYVPARLMVLDPTSESPIPGTNPVYFNLTVENSGSTTNITMPVSPSTTRPSEAWPEANVPSNFVFVNKTTGSAANPPVLEYISTNNSSVGTAWGAKVNDNLIRKDFINGQYVLTLETYAADPSA